MKQEVIQDFLNLPGIAGVALMDGRSRPYFCGIDRSLNFQQKEALAQGILQVVETVPVGFDSFEFQFTGYQVHIYKLEHGIILLVLTRQNLNDSDYLKTIKDLKAALQEDISNAVATFRLIAGNISLSGANYSREGDGTTSAATTTSSNAGVPVFSTQLCLPEKNSSEVDTASQQSDGREALAVVPPAPSTNKLVESLPDPSETIAAEVSLKDLIASLNHLSKFTTQYLGTHVIANYWKSTRPEHDWLGNFQIDRSAQFSLTDSTAQEMQRSLSTQEKQWIREWVTAFMKRCSQVIRDFPAIVEQSALNDEQRALLLG
jgi:hypothetical protein